MALEAELRERVNQSLLELEEVLGSLQHVKQLAETGQGSAEQLSRVASSMEAAALQFKALLEGVGQSGAVLQSVVEAVTAVDPAVVLNRIDAVARSIASVAARVAATVQLGEFAQAELGSLRASIDSIPGKIDNARRAQAAAIERLDMAIGGRIDEIGKRMELLENRVGMAILAAWVAAGLALASAVLLLQ
jgi:hypothetical protein